MRIAFLVTQLESGGAQRLALDLADALRSRGHVVETWFFYRKESAFSDARDVRVLLKERPRSLASLVSLVGALRAEFRRFSPEAAVSFTHYANVIGSLVAKFAGVPCRVASQHNPGWTYPRLVRWLDRLVGSMGAYCTNIVVSTAVSASFSAYPAPYRRRLTVVPNGIAARPASRARAEVRARLGIADDAFLVLAVGRLHPQKNHELLIKSLPGAPEIRLVIAGDGELRGALEQLAVRLGVGDRVRLLGAVPEDDVGSLMAAADAFAMPSRFEGQSVALIEALATPLPVVSSNIPSQEEVLVPRDQDPCAVLLDCDDAQAWSATFRRLAADVGLRDRLAQAAARRAGDFSLDATARGYEAAIKC